MVAADSTRACFELRWQLEPWRKNMLKFSSIVLAFVFSSLLPAQHVVDPLAQRAYLKASNSGSGDRLGTAVAVSGDTLVVAAKGEDSAATGVNGDQSSNAKQDSGAVYVFVRDGATWIQQAYLKASNTDSDDDFGASVAIDGDTIVVGAYSEDSGARTINGNQRDNSSRSAGAAYVFVRRNSKWQQEAYLKPLNTDASDLFGFSVAVSADTVVVGARSEASASRGVNGDSFNNSLRDPGAAYVFVRKGSTWTQQAYLKASNPGYKDYFGHSVSVSGNTVVVGAPGEDSNATGVNGRQSNDATNRSGAAYVFLRIGSTWGQEAYLKSSNNGAIDEFGNTVLVSRDTVVVGAKLEDSNAKGIGGNQTNDYARDSGAVYVFVRAPNTWTQQAYIKASNTDLDDWFGEFLAMSGDTLIVGAVNEDSDARGINGNDGNNALLGSGAAYVFVRTGSTWIQQVYLKSSNSDYEDHFGSSVGVSGATVVVGAVLEDSASKGVNGDQGNNGLSNSGAAYVFRKTPSATQKSVGKGCVGSGLPPVASGTVPVLGDSVILQISYAPAGRIGIGLLGLPHSGIGLGANCTLYIDLSRPSLSILLQTDNKGTWQSPSLGVGNNVSSVGLAVGWQAGINDPGSRPLGMALTNGVVLKVGY